MNFQKIYGFRGPWGVTAVLQLIYVLRKNCCGTGGRDGNRRFYKEVLADLKKITSKHLRPLPILFFLRVLSFWEQSVMILDVPRPSICYTWGPAWSNLNCPWPTLGRRDQEETQEVLVLETLWQFGVSSMWVLRDFRRLHVWEFFQTTSIWRFGFIILKIRNDSTHNCGSLSSRRREKKRRRKAAGSKKRKKTMFLPLLLSR